MRDRNRLVDIYIGGESPDDDAGRSDLFSRLRSPVPTADVRGTPFAYDDRNPVAQWLHPAPSIMATYDNAIWRQRAGLDDPAQAEPWAHAEGSPWKRSALANLVLAGAEQLNTPTGMVLSNFAGPAAGRLPALPMTKMAMARDMGFRPNVVHHGTATKNGELFSAFDPARTGGRTSGSQAGSQGVSVALSPEVANEFAFLAAQQSGGDPVVLPLMHRTERPGVLTLDGSAKNLEVAATLSDAFSAGGRDAVVLRNYTTPGGRTGETVVVLKEPNQLRSPTAAFDPAKRDSSDLLASLGGLGVAGGAALAQGAASGDGPAYASSGRIPRGAIPTAERPTTAAIRIGDKTYVGAHHGEAAAAAMDALGEAKFMQLYNAIPDAYQTAEGFITSTGRYVTRPEAEKLLIEAGLVDPKTAKGTMETTRLDRLKGDEPVGNPLIDVVR